MILLSSNFLNMNSRQNPALDCRISSRESDALSGYTLHHNSPHQTTLPKHHGLESIAASKFEFCVSRTGKNEFHEVRKSNDLPSKILSFFERLKGRRTDRQFDEYIKHPHDVFAKYIKLYKQSVKDIYKFYVKNRKPHFLKRINKFQKQLSFFF